MILLFSELTHTQQEVKLFGPAFSSPVIWSVIFQVLHFPGLAFSVAPHKYVLCVYVTCCILNFEDASTASLTLKQYTHTHYFTVCS